MGTTRYKVTYECECGENYGWCDKHGVFLFEYNRSCDIGLLMHKPHMEDKNSKIEHLGYLNDNAIDALVKILTQSESIEKWTDSEFEEFKNNK